MSWMKCIQLGGYYLAGKSRQQQAARLVARTGISHDNFTQFCTSKCAKSENKHEKLLLLRRDYHEISIPSGEQDTTDSNKVAIDLPCTIYKTARSYFSGRRQM